MTSIAAPPVMEVGRRRRVVLAAVLGVTALLFGLLAGQMVASGHFANVIGFAVVLLPVLIWKRPYLAPAVFLGAALLVEQFGPAPAATTGVNDPQSAGASARIPLTPEIPLFHGIGSLHIQPADLLLLLVLAIYLARRKDLDLASRPRSHMSVAIVALISTVVFGLVVGLAHHGSLRVGLMEARPYVYLCSTYMLTAVLVTKREVLRAVLWAFVVVSGFKALQGLYVFLGTRNMHPRPAAVLGHEEAYFFAVFIFLVLALWLFDVRGRLRKTATWLLPVVIAADLVNNRRAAWLVLFSGLFVLAVVGYVALPSRRQMLRRAGVITLVISAVYFPAYWNKDGGLAQPARAFHSAVSPDPRDTSSNLYRDQENANLQFNIRQGGLIGKGFGVPIDYALPIVDIKKMDPLIAYVPHNGVFYVLMRMGLLGGVVFWGLLAAGIIAGCRLARYVDREFAMVGAVLACALVGYALEGATDQGFFFYRIAFVTGTLLGLAEAARRLARMAARERRGAPSISVAGPERAIAAPSLSVALPLPERAVPERSLSVALPERAVAERPLAVGPPDRALADPAGEATSAERPPARLDGEGHASAKDAFELPPAPVPVGEGRRLGRNLAALASGQVVTWTMTFAWTLVVPRLLGPAGIGLIVSAWSVTGILGIALGFGTKNYLVRAMVVTPRDSGPLVGTGIVLRILLSPLFVAALIVWAHFAHYGHDGTLVLYLAGGATILSLLAEPIQAAFQAIERMEYLALSDVITKSTQGLLGIVLAIVGFGAIGFAGCWLVMSGVVLVLDAFWIKRYVRIDLHTTARRLAHMAKQSMAYWAFGLFFMVYLWIDTAMLSLMTNPTVVGWYGVPTKLFQTLMFVPVLMSTAWLPRLVSAFQEGPDQLHRAARTPIDVVLALGIPISAAVAIAADPLIHIVYGAQYDNAVPVLIILGLCIPFMYVTIMLSQVVIAANRQVRWTWVMAGATVFNPLVNAFLIPATQHAFHNGAIGAAISLLLTEIVIVAIGFVMTGRGLIDRRGMRRCGLAALASAAMVGVALALHPSGTVPSLAAAAVTFLALAWLLRLATPAELAFVRARLVSLIHRIRSR